MNEQTNEHFLATCKHLLVKPLKDTAQYTFDPSVSKENEMTRKMLARVRERVLRQKWQPKKNLRFIPLSC